MVAPKGFAREHPSEPSRTDQDFWGHSRVSEVSALPLWSVPLRLRAVDRGRRGSSCTSPDGDQLIPNQALRILRRLCMMRCVLLRGFPTS